MAFVSPSCENVHPEEDEILAEIAEGAAAFGSVRQRAAWAKTHGGCHGSSWFHIGLGIDVPTLGDG